MKAKRVSPGWIMGLALIADVSVAQQTTMQYREVQDVPYVDAAAPGLTPYQQERCKLDVYYPEGGTNLPVVVWFHGGGLTAYAKSIPRELKDQGLVVIAPNYRLSPHVNTSVCIADAAAAVAWVFRHASDYGGSPEQIFVAGHSAGGYLALMVGLDKHWLANHGVDANKLAGLCPFSGQVITHLTTRQERGIPGTQPVVDECAPLFHVRADAPPMLLLTGDREKELLGRYEENAYFLRMLKLNGHTNSVLHEMQGYGHSMETPGMPLLIEFIKTTLSARSGPAPR